MKAPILNIRCPTWEHLENFYVQKVKDGNVLLARVPFSPKVGTEIVIALDLPDGLKIHIDAQVEAVKQAPDGRKSAIKMLLRDFDQAMRSRLETIVRNARDEESEQAPTQPRSKPRSEHGLPVPIPSDVPIDELVPVTLLPKAEEVPDSSREHYQRLEEVLRTLREKAAHEVLGVQWDADVQTIRLAYFKMIKQYHPDVVARHGSADVSLIASELFIYINKAYDRLRDSVVASGKAIMAGPALLSHDGWIAGFDDLGPDDDSGLKPLRWAEPRSAISPKALASGATAAPQMKVRAPEDPVRAAPLHTKALFTDARNTGSGAKPLTQNYPPKGDHTPAPAELAEEEVEALMVEGKELLSKEDYDAAREHFARLLETQPRNRQARALYHVAYGHTLVARDKAAEALTQFEVALKHDPDCKQAKGARGTTSTRKRRPSLLERILKR